MQEELRLQLCSDVAKMTHGIWGGQDCSISLYNNMRGDPEESKGRGGLLKGVLDEFPEE